MVTIRLLVGKNEPHEFSDVRIISLMCAFLFREEFN